MNQNPFWELSVHWVILRAVNEPQSPAPEGAPASAAAGGEPVSPAVSPVAVAPAAQAAPVTPPGFRAGMAVLVGRTNAGKSTLLNALVGRKVSIVTPKPQTTRDTIHGIVHHPKGQVVFVDTPGFFHTRGTRMVQELHDRTREALADVDVVLHLVDPTREPGPEDALVAEALKAVKSPRILCIGKSDAHERPHRRHWMGQAMAYQAVVDVSGATGSGLAALIEKLILLVPEGEPLYPPSDTTNSTRDFQISEIIREQVYLQASDEVPYRTKVSVDKVEVMPATRDRPERLGIDATVFAGDERYQRMLIGKGGARVKQIREFSRRELQRVLGQKVALSLDIHVDGSLT
jgi:GTP-binding protein Era